MKKVQMYEVYDSQTGFAVEEGFEDSLDAAYRAAEYNRARQSTQFAVREMSEESVHDFLGG